MYSQDYVDVTNASIVIQSVIRGILMRRCSYSGKLVRLFTTTTDKANNVEKLKTDDYISAMPDDILSSILSLLNMKDAVKTRVLSYRWRYLCFNSELIFDLLTMFGINYNRPYFFKNLHLLEGNCKFAEAVDQFLQVYRGPKINSFKVCYFFGNESTSHIDRWISFVVEMQTTKIDLNFIRFSINSELYNFPFHLLSQGEASPLKILRLKSCMLRPSPNSVNCLNSLTTLDLRFLRLRQWDVDNISNGCKNLERLRLSKCILPKILFICRKFTCLRSFILKNASFHHAHLQRVVISTLNHLTDFVYIGGSTGGVLFKYYNLPCLDRLSLKSVNLQSDTTDYILNNAAEGLPNLRSLLIDAHYIVQYIPAQLTRFSHLKELELFLICPRGFDLLAFTYILNASPLLQRFYLAIRFVNSYFVREPQESSRDLHHHLKEAEIAGVYESPTAMDLAKYLLNNAVVLEFMTLNSKIKIGCGGNKWMYDTCLIDESTRKQVNDDLLKHIVRSNVQLLVL